MFRNLLWVALGVPIFGSDQQQTCPSFAGQQSVCDLEPLYISEPGNGLEIGPSGCDMEFPPTPFLQPPLILFDDAKLGANYTLIFIGNNIRLQWLVDNIPSCAFYNGNMMSFNQVAGYIPPMPIKGLTLYQMLLFEQSQIRGPPRVVNYDRLQFNLAKFVDDAQLCGPVAGIQFRSSKTIL